ncbi:MAG: hypothetical protein OXO49_06045 [Gammaproteobacteria bacterium]|nr:hypothetical protein [Gammaproteobacteria bacterium]MDE0251917.1 hypothetical protein [Gammaproteobacteria bacterium]MDE0403074.1 hypothetical protein [Gammaproteobacteria bacterium]
MKTFGRVVIITFSFCCFVVSLFTYLLGSVGTFAKTNEDFLTKESWNEAIESNPDLYQHSGVPSFEEAQEFLDRFDYVPMKRHGVIGMILSPCVLLLAILSIFFSKVNYLAVGSATIASVVCMFAVG